MTIYSPSQLAQLWTQNGGNPSATGNAVAIMMAESGGNTQAVGGGAYGLTQIQGDPNALNPSYAIQKMIQMSGNGQNWAAWCSAWAQPAGNCGHGNPNGIQAGSAAAKFLNSGTLAGTTAPATPASASSSPCVINAPLGYCLLNQSQLKAVFAGLLIAAGGVTMSVGVILLIAWGMSGTKAGRAVVQSGGRVNRYVVRPGRKVAGAPARRRAEGEFRTGQQRRQENIAGAARSRRAQISDMPGGRRRISAEDRQRAERQRGRAREIESGYNGEPF
jgi:hypothetical protein